MAGTTYPRVYLDLKKEKKTVNKECTSILQQESVEKQTLRDAHRGVKTQG